MARLLPKTSTATDCAAFTAHAAAGGSGPLPGTAAGSAGARSTLAGVVTTAGGGGVIASLVAAVASGLDCGVAPAPLVVPVAVRSVPEPEAAPAAALSELAAVVVAAAVDVVMRAGAIVIDGSSGLLEPGTTVVVVVIVVVLAVLIAPAIIDPASCAVTAGGAPEPELVGELEAEGAVSGAVSVVPAGALELTP
jgi:hypothetical protein